VATRLNALELDNALKAAGWTDPEDRRIGWALAMRESSGYFDIKGGPNENGTYDWGLFQINEIHKNNPNVDWGLILTANENAEFALYLTAGGHNFSAWGLPNDDGTITGYAKVLLETRPDTYQLYYSRWKTWYDRYPRDLALASAEITPGVVAMANLRPNLRNEDVREYQVALRAFVKRSGRNPDILNPSGATGYYGSQTKALTQLVFKILAYRKVLTYPVVDTIPNKTLVKSIGLVGL
jgi:Lysozyme like domain